MEKGSITILVKEFFGTDPIARSSARELFPKLEGENTVVLDFANVEEVGQAFAHELFIVWKRNHPDVEFEIVNACDDVNFMVKRVINTK